VGGGAGNNQSKEERRKEIKEGTQLQSKEESKTQVSLNFLT
jgi:hypothetical protein